MQVQVLIEESTHKLKRKSVIKQCTPYHFSQKKKCKFILVKKCVLQISLIHFYDLRDRNIIIFCHCVNFIKFIFLTT